MKSTTQLEKENLIPVGKCLLLPGGILFVIGLVLRLSTIDDILFFVAGFAAMVSGLIVMKKPEYIHLVTGL